MTDDILFRYITEQTDKEENLRIKNWLSESDERRTELARLKNVWVLSGLNKETNSQRKEQEIEKILRRIRLLNEKEKARALHSKWAKYAAILVLTVIFSGVVGYFIASHSVGEQFGFGDGEQFGYTEIIVPRGERSDVVLPDGSVVKLNSGSKLKFISPFQSDCREVSLEGEGFFKVVHNSSKPFRVKTSNLDIEVLGTTFNVSSYPGDDQIIAYLETGKVKINTNTGDEFFLKPSQGISYNKRYKKTYELDSKSEYLIDWTRGLLTVKDETIEEFSIKLERRYNIKILFGDDQVKHHHYTGSINDEDLNIVLEALRFASSLNYMKNGNIVTLFSK